MEQRILNIEQIEKERVMNARKVEFEYLEKDGRRGECVSMVVCNPGEEEKALLDRGYREVKIKNVKDNIFKPKEVC